MTIENQTDENSEETFGRYLRAARTRQNIPLDVIAQLTRISRDTLLLIEDENHPELPAEVYVKGFLAAYADVVNVDPKTVVDKYKASLYQFRNAVSAERRLRQKGPSFWIRLLVVLMVLAGIVGFTVYRLFFLAPPPHPVEAPAEQGPSDGHTPDELSQDESSNTPQAPVSENYQDAVGTGDEAAQPESEPLESDKGIYYLRVKALEDTWLKVIIDENAPVEYKMNKSDQINLEATTSYNILLGDAESAVLYLNEVPVYIQGKRGQMVNIQLPRKR